MVKLRQNINAFIRLGEPKGYVAECLLNCSQNMPKLKRLSGAEVIDILANFGF